jgi:hypothetical protein
MNIPKNVTSIGINAFEYNLLSNIKITNSIRNISNSAFKNNQISSITINHNCGFFSCCSMRLDSIINYINTSLLISR